MSILRAHLKIAFSLLILAIVASIAFVIWTFSAGGDTVSAQTVVENACKDAEEAQHSDVTMVGEAARGGETVRFREEIRFSGQDYHSIVYDESGVARAETLLVGTQGFFRESDENGVWGEWTVRTARPAPTAVPNLGPGAGESSGVGPVGQVSETTTEDNKFCRFASLSDVSFVGDDLLGDVEVGHYAVTDESYSGDDTHLVWDIWVDESGRMRQFTQDLVTETERILVTATVSGIGETNVIAAPVVSGASNVPG